MRRAGSIGLSMRSAAVALLSPAVFYKMHEATSDTISDSLGNGPDLTIEGTLTNIWDNPGWLTFSGDNYAQSGVDSYLSSVFNVGSSTGQVIVSFDYYFDGDLTNTESFFSWGNVTASTGNNGFTLALTNGEHHQITYRGTTSNQTTNLTGTSIGSLGNVRNHLTFDFRPSGLVTSYANGAQMGSQLITGFEVGLSLAGATQGLTISGRALSSSIDRYISSAGGNARLARFFAINRSTASDALAAAVNEQFYKYMGELPIALNGQ